MNIEDLTKSQIILLTLLVSFVTSIATGIITVTLLEQAPPAVTQTINRVVQNTVEKIVPSEGGKSVQTVVVKEEDLILDAIDQNAASLVAIQSVDQSALGTGFIVSKDGIVITDSSGIADGASYYVASAGTRYEARAVLVDPAGFAILRIMPTKSGNGDFKSFSYGTLGDSSTLKVGQTVIAPSSTDGESLAVAKGTIARLGTSDAPGIVLAMSIGKPNSGSPLIATDGSIVGIVLVRSSELIVMSSSTLTLALASIPAQE